MRHGGGDVSVRSAVPSSRATISHHSHSHLEDGPPGSSTPKRTSISNRRLSTVGATGLKQQLVNAGIANNMMMGTLSPRTPGGSARRRSSVPNAGVNSPIHSARGSRGSLARSSHTLPTPALTVNVTTPPTPSRVLASSPSLAGSSTSGMRTLTSGQSNNDGHPNSGPLTGQQLIAAVRAKHVEEIISLLSQGADVNSYDVGGNTPLIFASQFGFLGIVEKLIRSDAKLDLCNKEGQNALLLAAARGHWQVTQALIKAGCNVDIQDGKGETALMRCAYPATPQALKSATILCENGHATITLTNTEGLTALAIARQLKNEVIVKYLSNPQSMRDRAKRRQTGGKGKTLRPGLTGSTIDGIEEEPGSATPLTPLTPLLESSPVQSGGRSRLSLDNSIMNDERKEVDQKEKHDPILHVQQSSLTSTSSNSNSTINISLNNNTINPNVPSQTAHHRMTSSSPQSSVNVLSPVIPMGNNQSLPAGLSLKPLNGAPPSLAPPLSPSGGHAKKPSISQQHKLHKLLGEDPELFRQTPFHLPPPPSSSTNTNSLSPRHGGGGGHQRTPSHQYTTTVYPANSLFASLNQTPSSIAASTNSSLSHSVSAPVIINKRAVPTSPSLTFQGHVRQDTLGPPPGSSHGGRDTSGDGWDMHRILHEAGCRGALLKHMEKQLCDESLLFWMAVQEHKTTLADTSSEQCFKSARDIYTRFIPDTAAQCVNISATHRRPLHALFHPSRGAQERWLAMSPVARVALFNESEREIFRLMDSAVRQEFLQSSYFRAYIGAPVGSVPNSPLPSPTNGMPFPPPASLSLTGHHSHHGIAHHGHSLSHGSGFPSARSSAGISAAQAQSAGARPVTNKRIMTGTITQSSGRPTLLPEEEESASLDGEFARARFKPPPLQTGSKADRLLGTRVAPRSITPGSLPSQSSILDEEDTRLRTRTPPANATYGHHSMSTSQSVPLFPQPNNGFPSGNANGIVSQVPMGPHRVTNSGHTTTIYSNSAMPSLPGAYRNNPNPPLLPATSFAHVHSSLALRALESLAAGPPVPGPIPSSSSGFPSSLSSSSSMTTISSRPPPLLPDLNQSISSINSNPSNSSLSRPTSAARGGSPTRLMRQSRFKNGKGGLPGLHVDT